LGNVITALHQHIYVIHSARCHYSKTPSKQVRWWKY